MKRTLAVLLVVILLLPLVACGGGASSLVTEEETGTLIRTVTETVTGGVSGDHEAAGFSAGFGRRDVTPTEPVPLGGYGNSGFRIHTRVLDPLYVTCIALMDENGERMLIFQFDQLNIPGTFGEQIFKMVEKSTGIPRDHVLLNATHDHSGPDIGSEASGISTWKASTYKRSVEAAQDALADLDACTGVFAGTTETDRLNFVRRYYKENGFVCDNADYGTGEIIGRETPVDEEMRLVKFARKNQPDIVIANWQCHNQRTSGSTKTDLSSDFIGVFRRETEKELGVKMLFLQGGAGNIDPNSRIAGEARYSDYQDVGRALYEHLAEGLKNNMKEVAMGAIRAESATITGTCNHDREELVARCDEIYGVWVSNNVEKAKMLCKEYGISSPYEASAIISRSKRGKSEDFTVNCYAFGDVGIAAAPFEVFCQTYRDLRAVSPFAMTLTCGYSNDSQGYIPAAECWANQGYEVVTCKYVMGTAEEMSAKQLEMLAELKAK